MTDGPVTIIVYVVQHQQFVDGEWRDMRVEDDMHAARAWERAMRSTPHMVGSVRTCECRTTGDRVVIEALPPA